MTSETFTFNATSPSLQQQLGRRLDQWCDGALGQHILIDLQGCQNMPQTPEQMKSDMLEAAHRIEATVVTSIFHQFSPHGLSGVVVIAESHLAVHTWPEHGSVCIDLFTCSNDMKPEVGVAWLFEQWDARSASVRTVDRGMSKQ